MVGAYSAGFGSICHFNSLTLILTLICLLCQQPILIVEAHKWLVGSNFDRKSEARVEHTEK